jgi:hypothetical protein
MCYQPGYLPSNREVERTISETVRILFRSMRFYWPVLAIPLLLGLAEREAKGVNYIYVTSTSEKVGSTGTGGCSLQEAIYSANLHTNQAISGINPDGSDIFVTTHCVPGTGIDTIVLPFGATITMSHALGDAHNYLGTTGTPLISSNITIEANGSLIMSVGARHFRAFALGGSGSLTIRNAYIKGFVEKGGDGGCLAGGGMGAGGAIYATATQSRSRIAPLKPMGRSAATAVTDQTVSPELAVVAAVFPATAVPRATPAAPNSAVVVAVAR